MGIEKDFLMRQLMMLLEVIEKILKLRKGGCIDEAEQQIDYFYKCLKIEKDVAKLDINELIHFLEEEKGLDNRQVELIAFVLKEQGEMAGSESDRLDFFRKAYFLLNKVERESTSFSMDRQLKLAELQSIID